MLGLGAAALAADPAELLASEEDVRRFMKEGPKPFVDLGARPKPEFEFEPGEFQAQIWKGISEKINAELVERFNGLPQFEIGPKTPELPDPKTTLTASDIQELESEFRKVRKVRPVDLVSDTPYAVTLDYYNSTFTTGTITNDFIWTTDTVTATSSTMGWFVGDDGLFLVT